DKSRGQPSRHQIRDVVQSRCSPPESDIPRRAISHHRIEGVDGTVRQRARCSGDRRPEQRCDVRVGRVLRQRFQRRPNQPLKIQSIGIAPTQRRNQLSRSLDIVVGQGVRQRRDSSDQRPAAQRSPCRHRQPSAPSVNGDAEPQDDAQHRADVRDACPPRVAIHDALERPGHGAEPANRVPPARVREHTVGNPAGQQTAPAARIHPGSVSYRGSLALMKRAPRRLADLLNPAAVLMPASNVIMQLSLPGVGYGVLESPVDSGNVYKHPFKRARTTGTYLAAATVGTDGDRELIRQAVDTVHKQVRSTAQSPVSYNAFDPKLQLWVAACLFRYYVDQHELLYGPLDDDAADAVYQDAKKLGTTLQVPASMWLQDRAAFDEYWKRSLDELKIDPPVREHLRGVASFAFLPWPL